MRMDFSSRLSRRLANFTLMYEDKRRVASFGFMYDYTLRRLQETEPIPDWLSPIVPRVESIGGMTPASSGFFVLARLL